MNTLFSSSVGDLAATLVRRATATLAMLMLSPALTGVAMLSAPPLVGITRLLQQRTRDVERPNRRAVGLLNAHLQETLAGVEVIRAFGREQQFGIRFRGALQQALASSNRVTVYVAMYIPLMGMLSALATAGLLWAGTRVAAALGRSPSSH